MEQAAARSKGARRFIELLDKALSGLEYVLLSISGICLVGILAITIMGIVYRELLERPILWTNDLAGYLLAYTVMLSSSWLLKEKGHVIVDLVVTHFKGTMLRINTLIISVVSAVAFSMFGWFAAKSTWTLYVKGTVMMNNVPWPKFALILPLAVGSFFLVFRLIVMILECIWKPELFGQQDGHDTSSDTSQRPEMG